jgi:hypothetical protein
MKKFLLASGISVFILTNLSAQSFEKGSKVMDLRFEFGAYQTESHDKINNTSDDGGTASKIFNTSFEYGILNWLGVGAKFQYDNYFVENDTIYHSPPQQNEIITPTVGAFDIAGMANVHLAKKDHFDLAFGANFGVSFFHYYFNDALATQFKGTGSWIDIHLTPRFYFGNHFGIHLNLGYANFNYPNVVAKNSAQTSINAFSLKGSGATFGIGFQYRL